MKKIGVSLLSLGVAIGVGLGSIAVIDSAHAGWTPRKPIEFVIMAGKGGGADKLARFIQSIIEKHKIFKRISESGNLKFNQLHSCFNCFSNSNIHGRNTRVHHITRS